MKPEINLYNYWHYGDLFLARSFIKALSEKYKINFYHNKEEKVFKDIFNFSEIVGIPSHFNFHHSDLNNLNINTWMGVEDFLYIKGSAKDPKFYCSYKRYMKYIKKILLQLDIPLKDYDYYLPEINFSNLNTEEVKKKYNNLAKNYKNIILLCTGPTQSNQSFNFNFEPIINSLSDKFKDILFLTTTNIFSKNLNVKSSIELFPTLLDISYISQNINLIVGRSSGPYVYTLFKDNIYNKEKKYVCFCNDKEHALFYEYFKCEVTWSNNYDLKVVEKILQESIISL